MKTISSDYIKEIKEQIRVINNSLKRVQEAEKIQDSAVNTSEYDRATNEAIDASADVMMALEEAVRLASAMGCATGLYKYNQIHKIVEIDLDNETFEFDNAFVVVKIVKRNSCAPNECQISVKPKDGSREVVITDYVTFESNKQIAWQAYKQVMK